MGGKSKLVKIVGSLNITATSEKLTHLYYSYAEAEEIHAYYKGLAIKWNCMQYIKLSHRVVEARWSEAESRWNLKIQRLVDGKILNDHCNVLLSATGVLK